MTQQPQSLPANWYPDPDNSSQMRFWDGAQWTDQVKPAITNETAKKTKGPIYKNKWFWIAIAALIIIAWITDLADGDSDPAPSVIQSTAAGAFPSPEASTTPSATPTATPSTSPPTKPSLPTVQIEDFMKQSYELFNGEQWSSLCEDQGFYPYPCAIASMDFASGVLHITVQESITKDDAVQYANKALNFLCATDVTAAEFSSISWVEIRDSTGGARGQASASNNLMCQMNR